MSKVLITGSSDGLGLMAAQGLLAAGHEVVDGLEHIFAINVLAP